MILAAISHQLRVVNQIFSRSFPFLEIRSYQLNAVDWLVGLKQASQYKGTLMLWLLLLFHVCVLATKILISSAFKNYRLAACASVLPWHQSSLASLGGLGMLKWASSCK